MIDGGIEIDHPDLIANIWTNSAEALGRPNVDDDRNGRVDDIHGWDFRNNDRSVDDGEAADDHATHVAGTIGARGGNRIGVAGVNWNITIIPVKFIGDNPDGSTTGTFSDAAAAMDYVTALKTRGLNVVATNNSWGCLGCGLSLTMQGAIRRAGDAGIVVVAAAGNSNTDTDITPFYPAGMDCTLTATGIERGWDCLIAVASITGQGARSSFSNYGASSVDLGAPGSEIVSTFRGDYEVLQGTSMATPHVTGAVALCASISPSLGPRARKDLVLTTTTPTSSLSGATSTGGRLDVGAMAQGCGVPTTVPDLTGATEANALDALSGALLVPGTRTTAYHGSVGSGRIIATKPAGGTTVVQLSAVAYVVSKGPISVPDLVGDEATTVSATLLAAELTVGQVTQVFHAGVPVGYVISQTPVAGTPVGPGSAVAYVVSKGPISVPDLVGDEATTVSATLLAAELTVGQVTQVFHAGVPVGYVISQTPVAGTPVGPGSAVAYVVSKGPISVPDLVGDEATTVSATLLAAELTVGQVTQVFHAGVPVGYVISQTPVAGTPVGPGSAVAYVVSKGPISVPDLVGDEATTVSATLLAAELTVGQVTQVFHAGVPVGYVISQTPVAGTPVGPGSAVAYVVSKGPISVPDLVGDEATTVSATLLAAELTVGQVTQVFHAGVPVGSSSARRRSRAPPWAPAQRSPTS